MNAVTERETLSTRASREIGRVPEMWVTASGTDLGLSGRSFPHPVPLSVNMDEGTTIIGSARRLGYAALHVDPIGETWLIHPVGVRERSHRRAELDLNAISLVGQALRIWASVLGKELRPLKSPG